MRRAISYCEPTVALAGDVKTWKFTFIPPSTLPKGTRVKFDLMSEGREIDWELPTVDLKAKENVIFCKLPSGKKVAAKEIELDNRLTPQYEFVLPSQVPAGEHLQIVLGCPKENARSKKPMGSQAQLYSQRRKTFLLYINTKGKALYDDPAIFTMDIKGNTLSNIRVLTPSFVSRNKRFDVVVRFEDAHGNLTNNTDEDTLIELSYEKLRDNLKWKLFIPETGFITLPNLYFNEAGVYTIKLLNTKTNETFHSSPIKCFDEMDKQLFWGLLHGESEKYDSTENIESCLRHFRDERALNFFAASPFENQEETPNEIWKNISQNLADFNEADRFVTFYGFQWAGAAKTEGVRHLLFAKEGRSLMRKKDEKYNSLKKLYKICSPKELISIPSFTMGKGFEFDFKDFQPKFERVVEIYNAWGSSECEKKEGNSKPINSTGKSGSKSCAEGSIQKALLNNCRFGFVAGGLDDRGIYANFYDSDQTQHSPGMTAIIADELNRASLIEALYNRSCYATTGPRIVLGLSLAGASMGSELNTKDKPGLFVNRHLTGFVVGSSPIKKVEILRNTEVLKAYSSDTYNFNFEYDDLTPLSSALLTVDKQSPPFVFYYLRVTQDDDHMAWSSPIWVDDLSETKAKPSTAKKKK